LNQSIKIDFAAEIGCQGLRLSVTQFRRGSELHLSLTTEIAKWGSAKTFLYGGYDYSTRTTRPAVWDDVEPPSDALSYRGPMLFDSPIIINPAKFCGDCGQARSNDGAFCISCGHKFRSSEGLVGDLFDEITRLQKGSLNLSEFVLKVYETYCFAKLDPARAAILKSLIIQVGTSPILFTFVNGRDNNPDKSGWITIGQAQAISEKLNEEQPLSSLDLELARTILESAPITFGYWGAIKAALKRLPIVGNEKSFGVALANISNAPLIAPSRLGGANGFVNPGTVFDSFQFPNSRTLNYMARRIGRDLQKLAVTNSSSYIEVAKHFALNWKEPYRARSFAAGFIFHGNGVYLNESSRSIDRSLQPGRRSEAFPELWDQSPAAALEILSSDVKSSKALTMAFQVVEDSSENIPSLKVASLKYGIKSPYIPLRQHCIALLLNAEVITYESFEFDTWFALFNDASDDQIAKLIERCRANKFPVSAFSFRAAIKWAVIVGAKMPEGRLGRLAELALRYPYELNGSNRLPLVQAAIRELGAELFDNNPNVLGTFTGSELVALVQWLDSERYSFQAVKDAISSSAIRYNSNFSFLRISNIAGFLALESDTALEIAWAVLEGDQSDDVALKLLNLESIQNLSSKFKAKFVNQLILHTPLSLLPDVLRTIQEHSDTWRGFDIISALTEEAGPRLAWDILSMDSLPELHQSIVSSKHLVKAIGDDLQISQMKSALGAQAQLAIAYLADDKMRVKIDPEFVLSAATSANNLLSQAGLGTLLSNKLVSKYWIRLAESGLPGCLKVCRDYVGAIGKPKELTASVLALLDSTTQSAKKLGLSFLDAPSSLLDLDSIWSSLTESDDPEILARVAEEALVRSSIPDDRLATMDRRVLVSRRKSREAKESVKQRIDTESFELAPDRVRALLELARAQNSRDREWAISRLAVLSINGLSIPSFEAYEVSGAGNNG
jgi:hypothetical protein